MSAPVIVRLVSSRVVAALLLIAAITLGACDDATVAPPPPPAAVASVQVSGEFAPLMVGTERSLSAIPRAADGAVLTGRPVQWSSDNPSIATVAANGVVTAQARGSTTIRATVDGREGSHPITVIPPPVAQLELSASAFVLPRLEARTLEVTARDAAGRPLSAITFSWQSDDESVAVVTPTGRVVAVGSGTARITVTAGDRSATALVTVPATVVEVRVSPAAGVLPVGASRPYTVQAIDDRGRTVPASTVQWTSSSPEVARVTSSGLVTAVGRGYATITATVAGVSGAVALTVTHAGAWQFEANLFQPPVTLDTLTVREDPAAAVRITREEQLVSASFTWNQATGVWSLTGRVRTVEYTELGGNVIMRTTGVREISDAGAVSGYDWLTGDPFLGSSVSQAEAFKLSVRGSNATLSGRVRGYPLRVEIPLLQ
jgi:uncharacterized protein YjdB